MHAAAAFRTDYRSGLLEGTKHAAKHAKVCYASTPVRPHAPVPIIVLALAFSSQAGRLL